MENINRQENQEIIQINKEETDKNENKKLYLFIKIIILIIYVAIIVSTEITYRKKLFEKSIEYQEDIREKHEKKSAFYFCWKFFSAIGTH